MRTAMLLMHLLLFVANFSEAATGRLTEFENQDLQKECGTHGNRKRHRKIFGGLPASPSTVPWSLLMTSNTGQCTASLISSRHILLAAHCVVDKLMKPRFSYYSSTCDGSSQVFTIRSSPFEFYTADDHKFQAQVSRVILPGQCQVLSTFNDDIVIIELDRDVTFDIHLWPVCVASDPQLIAPKTQALIAAYGSSRPSNDETEEPAVLRYGNIRITEVLNKWIFTDFHSGGVATRPGDSGAGLIVQNNSRNYVVGVASGSNEYLGIYARVVNYYPDICRITGICRV